MHVHKGDTVQVIAGKDRGKEGKVLKALPKRDAVIIEGINMTKKHQRARRSDEEGQIVERPMPVHVSNVKKI